MALNGPTCSDVPLRSYSLTHSLQNINLEGYVRARHWASHLQHTVKYMWVVCCLQWCNVDVSCLWLWPIKPVAVIIPQHNTAIRLIFHSLETHDTYVIYFSKCDRHASLVACAVQLQWQLKTHLGDTWWRTLPAWGESSLLASCQELIFSFVNGTATDVNLCSTENMVVLWCWISACQCLSWSNFPGIRRERDMVFLGSHNVLCSISPTHLSADPPSERQASPEGCCLVG